MFYDSWFNVNQYSSQIIAILSASIALISNGMEFGWASPALPKLAQPDSPVVNYKDHPQASDLLQTLYMGGTICGMFLSFALLQNIGRRKTLLFSASIGLICWILVATATTVEQLYAARFFSGFVANSMYVGLSMYSAETSEPAVRGIFGALTYVMSMLGIVLSYAIIPYVPIYASAIVPICLSTVMLAIFYFQPESPYYLLIKKRNEEAEESLKRLRFNKTATKSELLELIAAVTRQESERGHPLDLVRIGSNRKATLIMMLLNIGQNMSGISVFVMNAQTLLQVASEKGGVKIPLSDEHSAIIFSVTMLAAGIIGTIMIDKYGRRVLLISSSALSTCCLALLSWYFYSAESFTAAGFNWIPLFTLIVYGFVFKCGLGVVPIVVTGELFPTNVKEMGMVLAMAWITVFGTVSLQIYHATINIGYYVPFTIFTACAALTTILIVLYVPETKGKTLEEIQMMLKGNTLEIIPQILNENPVPSQPVEVVREQTKL